MCKQIPLGRGYSALVDDEDYLRLSKYSWSTHCTKGGIYARRYSSIGNGESKGIFMHRDILDIVEEPSLLADHKNGNGLDNRRSNLRLASRSQNGMNRVPRKNNTHGFKGLNWNKNRGKYYVYVTSGKEKHYFGSSASVIEAALIRDVAALRIHKEFAWLNFPEEVVSALEEVLNPDGSKR